MNEGVRIQVQSRMQLPQALNHKYTHPKKEIKKRVCKKERPTWNVVQPAQAQK